MFVVKIRVEDALLSPWTVTGVGRLTVTPLGVGPFHPAVSVIVELKPSSDEIWMVADCVEEGIKENAAGDGWFMVELIAKSGATGAKTLGTPLIVTMMSVEWDKTPFVAVRTSV